MHARGPALNGMKLYGWRPNIASGKKLSGSNMLGFL